MQAAVCAAEGCQSPAAFRTRTRPAWCDRHIDEILAQGGLEPLEPFAKPGAYRLTRCLNCGVEAHYKLDYTLDQNRWGIPTCRACFWRKWYVEGRLLGAVLDAPQPPIGSVDRGRVVIALLGGGPVLYRCLDCGRLSAERTGDFNDACGCSGALGGRRGDPEYLLSAELREQFVRTLRPSTMTADLITANSNREVVWRDQMCGHEWIATVRGRQKVPRWRCPECRTILDSLAFHFPEIAAEWSDANPLSAWKVRPTGTISPTPEWRCTTYPSHVWTATLGQRTSARSRCPMCRTAGKSWIELDYAEVAAAVFGNAVSGRKIVHKGFTAHAYWYPDITVTLTDGRLLLIEYDGSYWHAPKAVVDEAKTRDLLMAGALVVRLREEPLPLLELADPRLLQIVVPSGSHNLSEVLEQIRSWAEST